MRKCTQSQGLATVPRLSSLVHVLKQQSNLSAPGTKLETFFFYNILKTLNNSSMILFLQRLTAHTLED